MLQLRVGCRIFCVKFVFAFIFFVLYCKLHRLSLFFAALFPWKYFHCVFFFAPHHPKSTENELVHFCCWVFITLCITITSILFKFVRKKSDHNIARIIESAINLDSVLCYAIHVRGFSKCFHALNHVLCIYLLDTKRMDTKHFSKTFTLYKILCRTNIFGLPSNTHRLNRCIVYTFFFILPSSVGSLYTHMSCFCVSVRTKRQKNAF